MNRWVCCIAMLVVCCKSISASAEQWPNVPPPWSEGTQDTLGIPILTAPRVTVRLTPLSPLRIGVPRSMSSSLVREREGLPTLTPRRCRTSPFCIFFARQFASHCRFIAKVLTHPL
jgi:hypothetical protein